MSKKEKQGKAFSKKEKRSEAPGEFSKKTRLEISEKIAKIMAEGNRPQEQAVAIAYSKKEKTK